MLNMGAPIQVWDSCGPLCARTGLPDLQGVAATYGRGGGLGYPIVGVKQHGGAHDLGNAVLFHHDDFSARRSCHQDDQQNDQRSQCSGHGQDRVDLIVAD